MAAVNVVGSSGRKVVRSLGRQVVRKERVSRQCIEKVGGREERFFLEGFKKSVVSLGEKLAEQGRKGRRYRVLWAEE